MQKQPLTKNFFLKPTLQVAKNLLGMKLSTYVLGKTTSGIIVEVEAYQGDIDQASHAFRGKTKRTEIMFGEGGFCYVYFIYGMYYCVNVVTEKAGFGSAVLIRALEPLEGLETMKKRRKLKRETSGFSLTNGPGKLCQALAIDKGLNGENLLKSAKINLTPFKNFSNSKIGVSHRIGISKSKELPWRFFLKDNEYVSKAK